MTAIVWWHIVLAAAATLFNINTFARAQSPTPTVAGTPYPSPSAWPKEGGRCEGKRNYTIIFHYKWDPTHYNADELEGGSKAGFSFLLCAAHQARFALWRQNTFIREEFKDVINDQNFTAIRAILDEYMLNNKTLVAYELSGKGLLESNNNVGNIAKKYIESPGTDAVNITVDAGYNATFISCFASLNPSPDWFVGFSLFDTCRSNKSDGNFGYIARLGNYTLRPRDAGYDSQESLSETAAVQGPAEPIHLKTNDRGPFGEWEIFDADTTPVPTATPHPRKCFPSSAVVTASDGRRVRMDALKVGDYVLTRNGIFSQVYMFSHQDPHHTGTFIRLHLSNNKSLAASSGHYVPLYPHPIITTTTNTTSTHDCNSYRHRYNRYRQRFRYRDRYRDRSHYYYYYVPMRDIRVGDLLMDRDGAPLKVDAIDRVVDNGLFNPHTMHGELVVNDVLVSTYTDACAPHLARAALSLPRLLHRWRLGRPVLRRFAAHFFDIRPHTLQ